ncbi:hypothetical protein [Aeromicrobium wangtongii]|uniref:hypothetical protein n=1 Tax=Aeromicrobium wangtongii TaxID=2969247 RepID=UPI0020172454|nr:hypothetical protein [Aeromicrobium wangtongii]MCL3819510.1 hypothetical protein [Aeromicrobium wangtongii]
MARGYRLVLPPPWRRINLLTDLEPQVDEIVERGARLIPKEISPDQAGPLKRQMRARLLTQVVDARERGGLDFYFTDGEQHGFAYNATFVVSGLVTSTLDAADVADALTEQFRRGADPVEIRDVLWARREFTETGEMTPDGKEPVAARRVDYMTAVPDDPRRWIMVTFSTIADGDPEGRLSALVVQLFDAMMTTWSWTSEPTG